MIWTSNADTGTVPSCADRQMLVKTVGAIFWSTLIQDKCAKPAYGPAAETPMVTARRAKAG